ncbi:MAG: hypothetical protein ACR2MO_07080 [Acidimicrobiales bacterium]
MQIIMRRASLVAVLAVLVGACSPGGNKGPETTVPTAPTTVATTAPVDPFAVPTVIDAAYVDRVLAALNKVEGDLVRDLVETNALTVEASTRLRAIYNDPKYQQEFDSLVKLFGAGTTEFKRPPGDRSTTVIELVSTSPACILAKTASDYSAVVTVPPAPEADKVDIVTLRATQPGADPKNLNPTPWSVSNDETINVSDSPPPRATCDAS